MIALPDKRRPNNQQDDNKRRQTAAVSYFIAHDGAISKFKLLRN